MLRECSRPFLQYVIYMWSMTSDGFGVVLQKSADVQQLRSWESEMNWQAVSICFNHVVFLPCMSKENLNRVSDCFGGCSSSACFVQGLIEPYPSIALKSSIRTSPNIPDNLLGDGLSQHFPQAIRGTQRGARFLHEGRIEEAIREFHSVCNRVPRTNYYQLMKFEQLTGWRDILHLQPRGKTMVPIWFPVNRDSLPFNQSRCGKGMNFYDVRVHSASFRKRLATAVQNIP